MLGVQKKNARAVHRAIHTTLEAMHALALAHAFFVAEHCRRAIPARDEMGQVGRNAVIAPAEHIFPSDAGNHRFLPQDNVSGFEIPLGNHDGTLGGIHAALNTFGKERYFRIELQAGLHQGDSNILELRATVGFPTQQLRHQLLRVVVLFGQDNVRQRYVI